ncbi:MAG: hypothetical protein ACFFB0_07470 [Promethearchaeota archaeon]
MFLDKLKEFPKDKILILATLICLLIVLLIEFLVFMNIETPTYGILDFEFAWTQNRVETILTAWGTEGMNNQTIAIYWDFLFIIGYAPLTFCLIILILRRSSEKVQQIGLYMSITAILTGIFDVIENINLLAMLETPTSIAATNAFVASFFATLKFGLLFAGIIYFIIAVILFVINKVRERNN